MINIYNNNITTDEYDINILVEVSKNRSSSPYTYILTISLKDKNNITKQFIVEGIIIDSNIITNILNAINDNETKVLAYCSDNNVLITNIIDIKNLYGNRRILFISRDHIYINDESISRVPINICNSEPIIKKMIDDIVINITSY